jgi:hypothetical protein
MNLSVYRSRTMTIPKNTIGSQVRSVFSRSTSRPIGSAREAL